MRNVQLTDELFQEAERRAQAAGFESVDEYIADFLQQDLSSAENLGHLFTPERLAHIDKAASDIKAGRFYTPEQVDAYLAETKASWLRDQRR